MTYLEQYQMDHPDDQLYDGSCQVLSFCPHQYYPNASKLCGDGIPNVGLCDACWKQEMPKKFSDIIKNLEPEENTIPDYDSDSTKPRIVMLKDSGDRTEFESGAVRDMRTGKGRCDLMPLDVAWKLCKDVFKDESGIVFQYIYEFQQDGEICHLLDAIGYFLKDHPNWDNYMTMFLDVAKHFEDGCEKYGENNWRKGIPAKVYLDSAVRHYLKWVRMDEDEPHDRAFVWNIMCCVWTCMHKPELNNYKIEGTVECEQ